MNRRSFIGQAVGAGVALAFGAAPAQTAIHRTPVAAKPKVFHGLLCSFGTVNKNFDMLDFRHLNEEEFEKMTKAAPKYMYHINGVRIETNLPPKLMK